jgi:aspartate/methionine/tyrosine aminotransferase
LCDADDEVLIPRPSYPLFEHLAALEQVKVASYELAYDGSWHIDFDSLTRALSSRARAVVVVNPNNPTGSFLKRDELRRLVELGLPIISDEVFSSFALDSDARRWCSRWVACRSWPPYLSSNWRGCARRVQRRRSPMRFHGSS